MLMKDNTLFIPVKDPNMDPCQTRPARLSVEERLNGFAEIEGTYTADEAQKESERCLKCPTHWCAKACPAGVPVTDFIARVRAGEYEEAYRLIRSASMLPEMCSRVCPQEDQCQSNCTRAIRGEAVGIGKLERFVVEQHYAAGGEEPAAEKNGKRVAVVGSGPAGLSAAQRLTDLGFAVTVVEAADRAGGLLEYGIPNTKLEKGVVARKVASLEKQGVSFRLNEAVTTSAQADALRSEFDAVVLTVGAERAREIPLEGAEGVRGILPAVEFLSANTRAVLDGDEPLFAKGRNVVIVGAGDTGSDCVGAVLRQGCASVMQVRRRPEKTGRQFIFEPHPAPAPAAKHDFSQEECKAVFGDPHVYQTTVKAVQADENGELKSVTLISMEPHYDEHFRLTMHEIPGSERVVPCQLLILAAGFEGAKADVLNAFGVEHDDHGCIRTEGYAASVPGVYACGDCRTGQSLVVRAMVDGRDCADAVAAALCDH